MWYIFGLASEVLVVLAILSKQSLWDSDDYGEAGNAHRSDGAVCVGNWILIEKTAVQCEVIAAVF